MNLPTTKIQRINIESGKRIIVTSDIHGNLSYLKNLLERVSFCDNDILVIVGDIIEKGPENLATLRYVKNLCEQGRAVAVIGNVDSTRLEIINSLTEENARRFYDYLLSLRDWCGSSFYDELALECGCRIDSHDDVLAAREAVIAHFKPEFDFLAELPTVIETKNYVFVHGGLREKNIDDNAACDYHELVKYDNFMRANPYRFDKFVVVGHWPVCLYDDSVQRLDPVFDLENRIISIDGGCGIKTGGQLNCIIIPDIDCAVSEITSCCYDDIAESVALDAQTETLDSVHICWLTRYIELLERGEEFSYIRHLHSGKELYIPNSYLFNDNEARDYTDKLLDIKAGDKVKILSTTSKGAIVKHNGAIGWYLGKYVSE